jgi:hypothetical protein
MKGATKESILKNENSATIDFRITAKERRWFFK